MSALLPCPFCGGAARLVKWIRPEKWVDCTACEAEGPVADTPEGAIAAWNRRAPAKPSEQEIDAAQREQDRNGELWAILFHDTDMPPAVFHGEGAEEAARRKYHAVRSTYNCVLMAPASIRRAPNADARQQERGAWNAFNQVLNWINTQITQEIDKKHLYAAVMEMRPNISSEIRAAEAAMRERAADGGGC